MFVISFSYVSLSHAEWKRLEGAVRLHPVNPNLAQNDIRLLSDEVPQLPQVKVISLDSCKDYFDESKKIDVQREASLSVYVQKVSDVDSKLPDKAYLDYLIQHYLKLAKVENTHSSNEFLKALAAFAIDKNKFEALETLKSLSELSSAYVSLRQKYFECSMASDKYLSDKISNLNKPLVDSLLKQSTFDETKLNLHNWCLKMRRDFDQAVEKNQYSNLQALKVAAFHMHREVLTNIDKTSSLFPYSKFQKEEKRTLLNELSDLSDYIYSKTDAPRSDHVLEALIEHQSRRLSEQSFLK